MSFDVDIPPDERSSGPLFVKARDIRTKTPPEKRAAVGELGTVAQCLGGDVVCLVDGQAAAWAEIAWSTRSGVTYRAWDGERISLCSEFLRWVPGSTECRFVALRPK